MTGKEGGARARRILPLPQGAGEEVMCPLHPAPARISCDLATRVAASVTSVTLVAESVTPVTFVAQGYDFATSLGMMAFDTVLYTVLALYLEFVWPAPHGRYVTACNGM